MNAFFYIFNSSAIRKNSYLGSQPGVRINKIIVDEFSDLNIFIVSIGGIIIYCSPIISAKKY